MQMADVKRSSVNGSRCLVLPGGAEVYRTKKGGLFVDDPVDDADNASITAEDLQWLSGEEPQAKGSGDGWQARAEALHQEALDLRALERLVRRYLGERGMIATPVHPKLQAVLNSIDQTRAEYPLPAPPGGDQ